MRAGRAISEGSATVPISSVPKASVGANAEARTQDNCAVRVEGMRVAVGGLPVLEALRLGNVW